MSRRNSDSKNAPIGEAAEKAESLIRGLQNRLAVRASGPPVEAPADLEWELEKYFAADEPKPIPRTSTIYRIRQKVVEGVAERLLNDLVWSNDGMPPVEEEVIERLIDLVFERLAENQSRSRELKNGTVAQTGEKRR